MVDRIAVGLFGRHVLGCAGDHTAARHTGVVDRPGQSEVGNLDPFDTIFKQYVGGFDVTMNQPFCMSRF